MTQRKGITCCCTTDHGGRVLEGYVTMPHQGHRVAGLGHRVWCPQCKGIFLITESLPKALGYAPALEGMRTGCGARLISSYDDLWLEDTTAAPPPPKNRSAAPAAAPANTLPASAPPPGGSDALRPTTAPALLDQPVHVVFRIGVFNDGTGNNFSNSVKARAACSADKVDGLGKHPDTAQKLMEACRKVLGLTGASYEGDETNVHRLYNLYRVTRTLEEANTNSDGRLYVYRNVYVQGIDTQEGQPDDKLLGGAFGQGNTGVIARAEEAVKAVVAQIQRFIAMNPGSHIIIDGIEFDLVGFSRGAASSRHLAWLIKHGGDESVMARTLRHAEPFQRFQATGGATPWALSAPWPDNDPSAMNNALNQATLPLKRGWSKHDLRIRFIGLFDCVAAYGLPDNADNDPVHLHLPSGDVDAVVHLAARDECRLNFASNPVKPHHTITLPGVHSDIGGGYPMDGWEHHIQGEPVSAVEPLLRGTTLEFRQTKAWRLAFQQILDYGWSEDTLLDIHTPADREINRLFIQPWPAFPITRGEYGGKAVEWITVSAAVTLQRKVRGEYQLISLRIMHALAQDAGVPFDFIDDNDPNYALPDELGSIHQKLLAYARAGGGKKSPLTFKEECLLSRRYLHQSANWNPLGWSAGDPAGPHPKDSDPASPNVAPLLFPMRPAPDRKRHVFDPARGH